MKLTIKSFLKEGPCQIIKQQMQVGEGKSHSFLAYIKIVQCVGICGHVYISFRGLDWSRDFFLLVSALAFRTILLCLALQTPPDQESSQCISNFNMQKDLLESLLRLDAGHLSFWFWWSLKFCISNKLQGNTDAADGPNLEWHWSIHYFTISAKESQDPWPQQPSPKEVLVSGEDVIGCE